jgi:hypothetical protein
MGWLLFIGAVVLVYVLSKRAENSTPPSNPVDSQLESRNYEWAQFIANYYALAHSKAEKGLIRRMLADIAAQGLPVPDLPQGDVEQLLATAAQQAPATATERMAPGPDTLPAHPATTAATAVEQQKQATLQVQLDNASLLLYFGAFLFVASAGLFVAFGGLPGALRTCIVLLVTFVLYGAGVWIGCNRKQLQQAGLAFAGIGMAVAPLTGLAAYNYVFAQSHAAIVWLLTSVLCMTLYGHALVTLRKPLISYIFIFTFLSLFESGISITSAPIYYFGWGMAVVGLGLTLANHLKGFWPDLQESAEYSAAAFVPLSVLTALVLVVQQGAGQLGVSLVLAAAYYWLQALSQEGDERLAGAVAAQVGVTSGVALLAYASLHSLTAVTVAITIVGGVFLGLVFTKQRAESLWRNMASVVIIGQVAAPFFAYQRAGLVLAAAILLAVFAVAVWLYQRREDAYAVAVMAGMAVPMVYGFMVVQPHLSLLVVALLLVAVVAMQFALNMMSSGRYATPDWKLTSLQMYILSVALVSVMGFWLSARNALLVDVVLASSMALIARRGHDTAWSAAAGVLVCVPLLGSWDSPGVFLAANLLALGLNVLLSLRYRQEFNRWLSTGLWLLLPVTFGQAHSGGSWSLAVYAWAYVVAMFGLVLSRAVARGVVLPSAKVPLASYARTASTSYVAGYCFAGSLAALLAAAIPNGRIHATAVLVVLAVQVVVLSRYVEKQGSILALIPLLAQAILLSAIRPELHSTALLLYLLASTSLALLSYFELPAKVINKDMAIALRQGALLTIFVTPLARLFADQTYWPMPLGMLAAGVLVYYHVRQTTQEYRELTGGLITVAIYWFMWFWGIHALQAYTHVLVLQLGAYAYWRHSRGEIDQSDQYLVAMLGTATVPLALQALGGQAGGLYGWWLLLEQIAFMLIGMATAKRLVTMWGLYVAVAAVLYQLRTLAGRL